MRRTLKSATIANNAIEVRQKANTRQEIRRWDGVGNLRNDREARDFSLKLADQRSPPHKGYESRAEKSLLRHRSCGRIIYLNVIGTEAQTTVRRNLRLTAEGPKRGKRHGSAGRPRVTRFELILETGKPAASEKLAVDDGDR